MSDQSNTRAANINVDELYLLAQLIAESDAHASQIADSALTLLLAGSVASLEEAVLAQIGPGGSGSSPDLLRRARFTNVVIQSIPDIFAGLSAERRIAVRQAFAHPAGDPVEKTTFRYLLQRRLDRSSVRISVDQFSDQDLSRALGVHLRSVLSPAPVTLKERLKYDSATTATHPSGGSIDKKRPNMAARISGGVLLILIVSAIATWIAQPGTETSHSQTSGFLSQIDAFDTGGTLSFTGSDAAQIERLIQDRTDFDIQVPIVHQSTVTGLSFASVFPDVTLPVVHYKSESGESLELFAFSYSLIQSDDDRITVDSAVLNQISDPRGIDIHELRNRARVVFRHRDDIYVTYTDENPLELRNRIQFNP